MEYLTYGDKKNKSIVLIHGMATTAPQCYGPVLDYLKDYYVVLVEVDGHIPDNPNTLVSLEDACSDVEKYIKNELNNEVYCLAGFSMGATMAVEIAGRNHVKINRLFIDAAFLTRMGLLTGPYTFMFSFFIEWLKKGRSLPGALIESIMGKGNRSIVDMLYYGVRKETIKAACRYVYKYRIHEEMKAFSGEALFIYGSNEPYPRKSAELLKSYLPTLKTRELKNMGHGQLLHNKPGEYSELLLSFLK